MEAKLVSIVSKPFISAVLLVCCISFTACKLESEHTSNSGPEKQSLPYPGGDANRGSAASRPTGDANSSLPGPGQGDFWSVAARADLAEVELGKLALEKAQDAEVKQFAEMMVKDHSGTSSELKALAEQKGVALPMTMDAAHQSIRGTLAGLSGTEFDRGYMDAMVRDHEAAVRFFEHEAGNAADTEARGFASRALPALKRHLEAAKRIQMKIGQPG